jgi:hypothetical protein
MSNKSLDRLPKTGNPVWIKIIQCVESDNASSKIAEKNAVRLISHPDNMIERAYNITRNYLQWYICALLAIHWKESALCTAFHIYDGNISVQQFSMPGNRITKRCRFIFQVYSFFKISFVLECSFKVPVSIILGTNKMRYVISAASFLTSKGSGKEGVQLLKYRLFSKPRDCIMQYIMVEHQN